jgi:hypothetical protein
MKKWTNEKIKDALLESIKILQIDRMPTAAELKSIGRNDLHCKVSRTKKYRGWAEELGLEMKNSETTKGNRYEFHVLDKIKEVSNHLFIRKMSTKHPFDLLVNDCVKVDVKVGSAHNHFGARAHTFGLHKKYSSCDIYICVALDEHEEIESYFIIPSPHVQLVTLNIGTNSKYNKYKDNWNFIYHFVNEYERAISR